MKTLLAIAATVALCAASPVAAKLATNGVSLNGIRYNAMTLNGRYLNGWTNNALITNAMTANGHNLNRTFNNAMTMNGPSRNGSLGTFLGSAEMVSVELPRPRVMGH